MAKATPAAGGTSTGCIRWLAMSPDRREIVLDATLQQKIGGPTQSELGACIWAGKARLIDDITARCQQSAESYSDAYHRVVEAASAACRPAGGPPAGAQ
jgi:hypothetical protein